MSVKVREEVGSKFVVVSLSGKLSKHDYQEFVPEVEKVIKANGKIRVLVEMDDFHGWEIGALWEDIKFDMKHFGDIEKLAIVGESKWQEGMAKFCKPFTKAKIEYFGHVDEAKAKAWLASD